MKGMKGTMRMVRMVRRRWRCLHVGRRGMKRRKWEGAFGRGVLQGFPCPGRVGWKRKSS